MLVTPQLSAFQWDSGLWDTWVLLERLHAVKSRQPRLCTQPELVRQLSLTIHLNPAAAVLGQTSFLLCLLADKISDSLWLWFSFGLHVQCSLKILVQPTQWLPSIGERVTAMFSVWTIFQLLFCQWATATHELLQLGPWLQTALIYINASSVFTELACSWQKGHTSSSCVSLLLLVPSWDCQTHQCSCFLTGKLCICSRKKMFNTKFFPQSFPKAGTQKTQQCTLLSPGVVSPSCS